MSQQADRGPGRDRRSPFGGITRSAFVSDLRIVLAERNFRRLFTVRLISQTGDGIVTAGIGTYVFFNAETFTSPAAAAAAFTVLYLPYSLIGPFAGVFIDRWSRRQILVLSALGFAHQRRTPVEAEIFTKTVTPNGKVPPRTPVTTA